MTGSWLSKRAAVCAIALGVSAAFFTAVPGSAGADATLQSWDDEQFVTSDARVTDGPTVVVTRAGTAVAMWLEQRLGQGRVYAAERAAGSSDWSTPEVIKKGAFYATIEAHGRDRVTVAWQSDGKAATISARTRHPDGSWGATQQIAQWQQPGGILVSLVLASNASGDMAAVWTRGQYIRVSYRAAGGAWLPETKLDVPGAYAYDAVANVARNGEVDVVFEAPIQPGRRNLYVYHRALDGTWTGQKVARFGSGFHSRGNTFTAAANGQGDVSVAWMERASRNDPWSVVSRFQPAGGAFTAPELVATRARVPNLDIDASGITTLTWLARESGNFHIDLARRSPGGTWTPPQTLASRSVHEGYYPQLAVDVNPVGDAVVHLIGQYPHDGGLFDDHRTFRCPAGSACGEGFHFDSPSTFQYFTFAIAPGGGATAVWTRGCATEECIPTSIRSRQMTPVS